MTYHDEMKVVPDRARAEELRRALHERAMSASPIDDAPSAARNEIPLSDPSTSDGTRRRLVVLAAAALIVVALGAAAVAIGSRDQGDGPSPAVTPVPTPLPSDSATVVTTSPMAPETDPSTTALVSTTTTHAGTTIASAIPPLAALGGEQIVVTPELIRFGEGLVGSSAARADDGGFYVVANRYESEIDLLVTAEFGVLAAFDSAGEELWRVELDRRPSDVTIVDGDLRVAHAAAGVVSWFDRSGRPLAGRNDPGWTMELEAFGSRWATVIAFEAPGQLIRIDDDSSTTSVELGYCGEGEGSGRCPGAPVAGAGAIWVPLGRDGVAKVDPATLEVTTISADEIGHAVEEVALDGDVAYVANDFRVTSLVGEEVRATATFGTFWYLGSVDSEFGVLLPTGEFVVLGADDPMKVGTRTSSLEEQDRGLYALGGEPWMWTGPKYGLRRLHLLAG